MSTAEPAIAVRSLVKRFGQQQVLDHIDLEVPAGQLTTVLGQSGVGKSVLLKCLSGLLSFEEGEVRIEGVPLGRRSGPPPGVSYVFQHNALFDGLSAFENVALGLREGRTLSAREIRRRVDPLLEVLDLGAVADRFPSQLSGGMRKRVALARALALEPRILLFDEPTTGLDPMRKNSVFSLIAESRRRFGFTALVVSHDIPDSLFIADSVALLDGGRMVYAGPPGEVWRQSGERIQAFVEGSERLQWELLGVPLGPPSGAVGGTAALRWVARERPNAWDGFLWKRVLVTLAGRCFGPPSGWVADPDGWLEVPTAESVRAAECLRLALAGALEEMRGMRMLVTPECLEVRCAAGEGRGSKVLRLTVDEGQLS